MGCIKWTLFSVAAIPVALMVFARLFLREPIGPSSRLDLSHLSGSGASLWVEREQGNKGVYSIYGDGHADLMRALGYVHAKDRFMQMFFVRAITRGELSSTFQESNETLGVDESVRRLGFHWDLKELESKLSPEARSLSQAYADGVNAHLKERKIPPLGFMLTGVGTSLKPWEVADTLVLSKFLGFVGLASSQLDFEKWLVELAQQPENSAEALDVVLAALGKDSPLQALKSEKGKEVLELMRKVRIGKTFLPETVTHLPVPGMRASNNWAVSGKLTASGKPIYSSDPHLHVLRLPAFWYEVVLHDTSKNFDITGFSIPGMPTVLFGRSSKLAWGLTYGFMDQIDFFIEHCKGNACRGADGFKPVDIHREVIGKSSQKFSVAETPRGILDLPTDLDPQHIPEGYYLSYRWTGQNLPANNLNAAVSEEFFYADSAASAAHCASAMELSANFIFTDTSGNIAYQQTGRLPRRKKGAVGGGMLPVPAWSPHAEWQGFHDGDELHFEENPDSGIIVTANNFINPRNPKVSEALHSAQPVNYNMGDRRVRRIQELLQMAIKNSTGKLTVQHMTAIQADLESLTARMYMEKLRDLLPEQGVSATADALRTWDLRYSRTSQGAAVFEHFYYTLHKNVFGRLFDKFDHVYEHIWMVSFHYFDELVMSAEASAIGTPLATLLWGHHGSRLATFQRLLNDVLRAADKHAKVTGRPLSYGDVGRTVSSVNIFFGGKLPRWVGLDIGPFVLEGSRDTVNQGQLFDDNGRQESFAPSLRMVTDMATEEMLSVIPGGVSDVPWSGLYTSEFELYRQHGYKRMSLRGQASKR